MAVKIDLTVRQKRGDKGSLEAWGDALQEPTEALESIGEVLSENLAERFATNTDPWGNPWPPPSPVTLALRGGEVDIDLGEKRFARVEGTRVFVGLRSAIARIRQFGAPNNRMFGGPSAPIPPRPALPVRPSRRVDFPSELYTKIMDALRDGIREAVRSRGTRDE